MSESLPQQNFESEKNQENHRERDGSKAEKQISTNEQIESREHQSQEKIDELLRSAQEQAKNGAETAQDLDSSKSTKGMQPQLVSKDLQISSLKQTLNRVQKKLPFDQKILSKIVHKPAVDAISNAAEKTVARPSGLAMGGAFSLVFSLFTLWLSYFFGYEYNYVLGIASFIAGFFIGLMIELLLRAATHKKRKAL